MHKNKKVPFYEDNPLLGKQEAILRKFCPYMHVLLVRGDTKPVGKWDVTHILRD